MNLLQPESMRAFRHKYAPEPQLDINNLYIIVNTRVSYQYTLSLKTSMTDCVIERFVFIIKLVILYVHTLLQYPGN